MVRVSNLYRNGRQVPNQFEIKTDNGFYFQSYASVCAHIKRDEVILSKNWNYSQTTLKYVKQFLNGHGVMVDTKGSIQSLIDNGKINLVDYIEIN